MIRVLHILPFEKYVDCVIGLWGETIEQCDYVCLDSVDKTQAYIFPDRIQLISKEKLCAKLSSSEYDVIVFSSLPINMYEHVLRIPQNKIVIWQSVGYDIYAENYPYPAVVSIPIYKQATKAFIDSYQKKSLWMKLRHIIAQSVKFVATIKKNNERKNIELRAQKVQKEVLNRVDYISTVLDPEYELLQTNPNVKAKFFRFKYTRPFHVSYNDYLIDFHLTKYLLIGNSGDETNNHLDVLSILERRNISTPLYAPIAYGGEQVYLNEIKDRLMSNSDNIVQTTFIERAKYLEILHKCRAAVFGHIRQQALGNINVMLAQGCKVFLYKDSVTYDYYKQLGFHIYSIEDDLTQKNIDTPLTKEQILHNRSFFEHAYDDTLNAFKNDVKDIEVLVNQRKNNP